MAKAASNLGLPPDEIIRRIKVALKRGGGGYSWEDVSTGLILGRFQIFWNGHGACITEIVQTPQKRYLNCFVVAGELPGVMELHDQVEAYGLTQSCEYMMTSARMGWQTVLPDYGWKKHSIVFVRDLEQKHG